VHKTVFLISHNFGNALFPLAHPRAPPPRHPPSQEEYKKQLASNFLQDGGNNASAKILAFKSKVGVHVAPVHIVFHDTSYVKATSFLFVPLLSSSRSPLPGALCWRIHGRFLI